MVGIERTLVKVILLSTSTTCSGLLLAAAATGFTGEVLEFIHAEVIFGFSMRI